jgi:hypothetical protein
MDPTGEQDIVEYSSLLRWPYPVTFPSWRIQWCGFDLMIGGDPAAAALIGAVSHCKSSGSGGSGPERGGSGPGGGPGGGPDKPRKCQVEAHYRPVFGFKSVTASHSYFQYKDEGEVAWHYMEGGPQRDSFFNPGPVVRREYTNHNSQGQIYPCGGSEPSEQQCPKEDCILDKGPLFRIDYAYGPFQGPNSNTWLHRLGGACGISDSDWSPAAHLLPGWVWSSTGGPLKF